MIIFDFGTKGPQVANKTKKKKGIFKMATVLSLNTVRLLLGAAHLPTGLICRPDGACIRSGSRNRGF